MTLLRTRAFELTVLTLLASAVLAGEPGQSTKFDAKAQGRKATKDFFDGKLDGIWSQFSPQMKSALVSVERFKTFRDQVVGQLGAEASVESEDTAPAAGVGIIYTRHARFAKLTDPIVVYWAFSQTGDSIEGFYIKPAQREAPSNRLNYQIKADIILPFEGPWFVFWGGRSIAQNYHAVSAQQRFAYDFIILENGRSHTGDGKTNEQYHCFGKPVLAPGAGTVVAVENGIGDNIPGVMNDKQILGNHVIIDHGNDEFSFLAHFKMGSVKVKPGQKVEPGEVLGLCGNSGNSSEPHIHYHMQTTPDVEKGEGLPVKFANYLANGGPVGRGEPIRGETVESQSSASP